MNSQWIQSICSALIHGHMDLDQLPTVLEVDAWFTRFLTQDSDCQ